MFFRKTAKLLPKKEKRTREENIRQGLQEAEPTQIKTNYKAEETSSNQETNKKTGQQPQNPKNATKTQPTPHEPIHKHALPFKPREREVLTTRLDPLKR